AQVAGFAVALRAKGVSPDELSGMASAMLDHAEPITVPGRAVDLVGTGGDGAHTVNISTMGAVVAAGAGAHVVKHGNRAASSSCGAADLLEELGVRVDLLGDAVARCVAEAGIGFCFAPRFHPALRHAAGPRRELGVPTPFNFLGPVTNPAQPPAMAVGCADARMAGVIAQVLADRGSAGLVFRGDDGLDELTVAATSKVWWVRDGQVEAGSIDPVELGIPRSALDALKGGDAAYNAKIAHAVFAGERGPVRDAVLLNAAAAIAAYDGQPDPAGLRAGLARAAESIDSGAAASVLQRWVALCATL
ncbi:MAG TPA: anthranilate phosphoribosyltransferase, partial [Mycobacteriales bacterium]|nr:anthranilate phosphoribosyltransferase [Mycobacteriales bacterium]